ncbi:MAG: SAM-dependent methyltransferase [Pseudomonadota bacterium]|nr:SAM-dependent methyltransferase [Pseudomonadota bacterium]
MPLQKASKITLTGMPHQLPTPSLEALRHCDELTSLIRQRIMDAGGWIRFGDYMDLALYASGLGYYSAGSRKFGEGGDFVTAPEFSSLFSRCIATQCDEVLAQIDRGVILELGAGTGHMAADILLELEARDALPERYLILELSADLRARQQQTLQQRVPQLAERVEWQDELPKEPQPAVVLANEVIDALPVERFSITDDGLMELGVCCDDSGFGWLARPAAWDLISAVDELQAQLGETLPAGLTSEIRLRFPAWLAELARSLQWGMLLFIDYGLSRREYYHRARTAGTLRCHYRHRAHDDPFAWPGLQDITAWVDFSQIANAAEREHLQVSGYTTQAQFLIAAGLDRQLERTVSADLIAQVQRAGQARRLVMPGEMGETFKAMALTRGSVDPPSGFAGRDLRRVL